MRKPTYAELKATKKVGMHRADKTLYMRIGYNGGRSWIQRLVMPDGRRADIGLGSFDLLSLREARDIAHQNRRAVRIEKRDILVEKEHPVPTFADAAEATLALHEPTWKDGGKTAVLWRSTLRDYVMPKIGKKPITDVSSSDVLSCITPIWNTKRATATKVKRRISAVMRWGVAEGHIAFDPVSSINAALPKSGGAGGHFRAIPFNEVPSALARVRVSNAFPSTILVMELGILTATRSSEIRLACWHEFDLDEAIWTLPPSRTKMSREFRVPLCTRALEILHEARDLFGHDDEAFVFPGARIGRPLSDAAVGKLMKYLKIDSTFHGLCRSAFRSWAASTGKPAELSEMFLGHVAGATIRAYQRDDLLKRRRRLAQQWSDYLDGAAPAKVIELRPRTG